MATIKTKIVSGPYLKVTLRLSKNDADVLFDLLDDGGEEAARIRMANSFIYDLLGVLEDWTSCSR